MDSVKKILWSFSFVFYALAVISLIIGLRRDLIAFSILSAGFVVAGTVCIAGGFIVSRLLQAVKEQKEKLTGLEEELMKLVLAQRGTPAEDAGADSADPSGEQDPGQNRKAASDMTEAAVDPVLSRKQAELSSLQAQYDSLQEKKARLSEEMNSGQAIEDRKLLLADLADVREALKAPDLSPAEKTSRQQTLYRLQTEIRKLDVTIIQRQNKIIEERNIVEEEMREIAEQISQFGPSGYTPNS